MKNCKLQQQSFSKHQRTPNRDKNSWQTRNLKLEQFREFGMIFTVYHDFGRCWLRSTSWPKFLENFNQTLRLEMLVKCKLVNGSSSFLVSWKALLLKLTFLHSSYTHSQHATCVHAIRAAHWNNDFWTRTMNEPVTKCEENGNIRPCTRLQWKPC